MDSRCPFTIFESPFGPLTFIAGGDGLRHLYFPRRAPALDGNDRDPYRLAAATRQLEQYFNGERTTFELRLDCHGTPFQRRVWRALQEIPYSRNQPIPAAFLRLDRGRVVSREGSRVAS